MPRNIQLLKQIRRVTRKIASGTDNPENLALLNGADVALNELMLLEEPAFYLDHYRLGARLLDEGYGLRLGARDSDRFIVMGPNELSARLHPDVREAETNRMQNALSALVGELDPTQGSQISQFLDRVTDWEVSLYAHRHEDAEPTATEKHSGITRETLSAYLQKRCPLWTNLRVTEFKVLYGGFSKTTILFETMDDLNGRQSLVIRAEQQGTLLTFDGSDIAKEYPTIQLVYRSGLPVAEPLWFEPDASHLGNRFIVSRKMDGSNYGNPGGATKPLCDSQVRDIIAVMARMHQIRLDPDDPVVRQSHLHPWMLFRTLKANTHYFVESFLKNAIDKTGIMPSPLLTRLYYWLLNNVPPDDATPVITHLDYSLNNLLLDQDRVTAVLDWETSRVGDPAEEIVWTQANIGEYISRDEFLRIYKADTGYEISEYRLAYFEVMSAFRVIIVCMCSLQYLDKSESADITLCASAYRYLYRACGRVNELIAKADSLGARESPGPATQ